MTDPAAAPLSDATPKLLLLTRTVLANLVLALAVWANAKWGIQVDAETQAAVVGLLLVLLNTGLRAVTSQPAALTRVLLAVMALPLLAVACTPAQRQLGCAIDGAWQPLAVSLLASLPETASLAAADVALHPVVAAACLAVGGVAEVK